MPTRRDALISDLLLTQVELHWVLRNQPMKETEARARHDAALDALIAHDRNGGTE